MIERLKRDEILENTIEDKDSYQFAIRQCESVEEYRVMRERESKQIPN